jgi:hypothetical protein
MHWSSANVASTAAAFFARLTLHFSSIVLFLLEKRYKRCFICPETAQSVF